MASDSGSRRAASGGAALRRTIATMSAATSPSTSRREYRVDLRISRAMHSVCFYPVLRLRAMAVLLGDGKGVDLAAVCDVPCAWRKNAELATTDGVVDGESVGSRRGFGGVEGD